MLARTMQREGDESAYRPHREADRINRRRREMIHGRRVVARKEHYVGAPSTLRTSCEARRFARRPGVMIGAVVRENPFFVPRDQFLGICVGDGQLASTQELLK